MGVESILSYLAHTQRRVDEPALPYLRTRANMLPILLLYMPTSALRCPTGQRYRGPMVSEYRSRRCRHVAMSQCRNLRRQVSHLLALQYIVNICLLIDHVLRRVSVTEISLSFLSFLPRFDRISSPASHENRMLSEELRAKVQLDSGSLTRFGCHFDSIVRNRLVIRNSPWGSITQGTVFYRRKIFQPMQPCTWDTERIKEYIHEKLASQPASRCTSSCTSTQHR